MNNFKNPILSFRNKKVEKQKSSTEFYDLIIGARISKSKNLLIESDIFLKEHLATLITETREAIDSSENS